LKAYFSYLHGDHLLPHQSNQLVLNKSNFSTLNASAQGKQHEPHQPELAFRICPVLGFSFKKNKNDRGRDEFYE
jgi:hypothetical protein